MDGPQVEQSVFISLRPADNLTLEDRHQQEVITDRVSAFIGKERINKNDRWSIKFESERTKHVPQRKKITGKDAEAIMKGLGITLKEEKNYLIAYHLLSIIENYKRIPIDKQLSENDQKKDIYAKASTAAEYFRGLGANENDLIEIIDTLLIQLNKS